MFDFEALDDAELRDSNGDAAATEKELWQETSTADDSPGDAASSAASTQVDPPGGGPGEAAGSSSGGDSEEQVIEALQLDEERWRTAVVEPSQMTLNKWMRSESVRDILRFFMLEDVLGGADTLHFRDAHRLLEAVGLTTAEVVGRFAEVPAREADAERLADQVLARFAAEPGDQGTSSLRFRDLFRLLEVLGVGIHKFVSKFADDGLTVDMLDGERAAAPRWRFGEYIVSREIGSGFRGPCCYLAEHVTTGRRAALKWPVGREELNILQAMHRQAASRPGLPQVLASGLYDGDLYVVAELLGSPLSKVFERLEDCPLERRWAALRVIGRLLLRRLQAVHDCGYVHCDVSPENVLLGRARLGSGSRPRDTLYLIDFGLARRHPGGAPLEGWHGSSEWSSVRSADGGIRLPEDDLEALGWILVNGLFGQLPWFERLSTAYARWDSAVVRGAAVKQVQETKRQLFDGGWDSFTGEFRKLADAPAELQEYFKVCQASSDGQVDPLTGEAALQPDYKRLLALLGAPAWETGAAAADHLATEEADLLEYQALVVPLLH